MDCDPGILCVNHCGPRIFCFELPENCPVCRTNFTLHAPNLVPFRVPYPFVRAHQYSCAVLIKPTSGDFLNDYEASADLHIGVTDSKGKLLEYDQRGLSRGQRQPWGQSLVIHQSQGEGVIEYWDQTLSCIAGQDCWTPQRYNEETFNCYTFVLAFLRCLQDGLLSDTASSKVQFCKVFVAPPMTVACKYIAMYRCLKDRGYYVNRTGSPQT